MEKALANITYFGSPKSGFYGIMERVKEAAQLANLNNCKFCGGSDLRLANTTTPTYRIECACGIELTPTHKAEEGWCMDEVIEYDEKDLDSVKLAHKKAVEHIISKWNGRGG